MEFIMGLDPISYIRTDADSGRKHWGMGAQSVEKLMNDLGIGSMGFAGLIKSPKEETKTIDVDYVDENGNHQTYMDIETKVVPGEYIYGLRYEEFIAPIIKVVQMQQQRINDLEQKMEKIIQLVAGKEYES